MLDGEYTTTTIDKATLQTHDKRHTPHNHGLLTVTTHRVIWQDPARTHAIAVLLSIFPVRPVEDKSSPLRPRALLRIGSGVRVVFESSTPGKDRDRFIAAVRDNVSKREWDRLAQIKAKEAEREQCQGEFVSRRIGASGVQDRVYQRNYETRNTIDTGFASLLQLRQQAQDLTRIANMFKSKSSSLGTEDNELLSMMAEMGIESPVTKLSVGGNVAVYREQLSRQMSEFLHGPLLNVGGIMTLTDAYCLVMRNRATTELVSPQDFHSACLLFEKYKLPIQVVMLESRVLALSLDSSKDNSNALALRKIAEERASVTPIDIMRIRHVPIQRATAMLEEAEKQCLLARDETTEGLRFFPNMFASLAEHHEKDVKEKVK